MTIALSVSTSEPIEDFSSLKDAISAHLDRDDLEDHYQRFVQLLEAHVARRLRVLDQEVKTTLIASAGTLNLPDDCLAIRSLNVAGAPLKDVRGMSPSAIPLQFDGESGCPRAYTRVGDMLYLSPPPASDTSLDIVYIARFTPLTEISASNWVLDQHPDVYFYGCLAHAYAFIEAPDQRDTYANLFEGAIQEIIDARNKDRWGSAPLSPNTVRQVRSAPC